MCRRRPKLAWVYRAQNGLNLASNVAAHSISSHPIFYFLVQFTRRNPPFKTPNARLTTVRMAPLINSASGVLPRHSAR